MVNNDYSTRLKIIHALIQKKEPMTLTEIAKESELDKELVFHHLPKLKEDWLIAELENKTYACQSFFYDDDITEDLNNLMKVIVKMILRDIRAEIPDIPEDELEKAVKNNLECFIQTFAIEIMD